MVKGRNPIELVRYKREVTTIEKGDRMEEKKKTGEEEKNRGREKNTKRGRPNGRKHLRGENSW